MNREQHILAIIRHIIDPRELSDKDVELIWKLIDALTWSKMTSETAYKAMEPVVELIDNVSIRSVE